MSQKRKGDTAVITDKERKNREELAAYRRRELFRLMRENPELPVVPMVDWEITGDDNGYWLGAWGSARIDEYLLISNREEVVFKNDDDVLDVLERYLSDEEFEKLPEADALALHVGNSLTFSFAILPKFKHFHDAFPNFSSQ